MRNIDRFRGCLLGGAIGDALGYPVEFMSLDEIRRKYGKNGLTDYVLSDGFARISDDTQMTLFTATGLLLGATRASIRGISGPPSSYIQLSYKDWYRTQMEEYPLSGPHFSWLDDVPELFSRRAPGNTCLSTLAKEEQGTIENPINNSKGCGGVMRVAPIGLYFGGKVHISLKEVDTIGAEAAALTHGHPLGYIPAAGLVHMIYLLSYEDAFIKSAAIQMLNTMQVLFKNNQYIDDFTTIIEKAIRLADKAKIDDADAVSEIGQGWVAEEALAIAIYSAMRYQDDFGKAIITAVNHDGDSDSTGSLTGNILGAKLGLSVIPERFLACLELKDIITEIADDLFHDCQISSYDPENPEWEAKYFQNRRYSR